MNSYQMEARVIQDNHRLELTPPEVYFRSDRKTEHEYRLMELHEVKASIERHVDNCGDVAVLWDTKHVCVHCGCRVKDAMTDDGPGCCDKAVAHYDAWKAAQA